MSAYRLAVFGCTALLAVGAAACGDSSDDDGGNTTSGGSTPEASAGVADTVILGSTDKVVALDPVGAYDLGSQQLIGNIYQNLLSVPAGGNKPEPDAAESCEFTDPKTYVCKLKPDLKFSSGDPLTSEDVKFSLDRMVKIADPTGPFTLLGSLDSVEATDPMTVTMKLKKADATFPFILTHNVAAIVPNEVYSADAKQPDDKIVGSGPYKLDKYTPNQQAVFSINPEYNGPNKGKTPNFIVQYFEQASALKLAIEQGEVDIAYRSLSPTDLEALRNGGNGVKVVDGAGTEIRYITFNVKKKPVDDVAVRKAIAQVIDREAITTNVYKGTATPLYSTVPSAFPGAKPAFQEAFGDPDPAKAKAILEEAGVSTPVTLDGWYTPTHYGPVEADLWNELKRQLEGSGLFKVSLDSTEWDQYKSEAFEKGTYYFYGLGWFPDFPDADNYLSPFMRDGGFFQNGYSNKEVNDLLDEELATDDAAKREEAFGKIQDIEAKDVPLIPLWEGKQVAAVREGVEGVETTFDPAFQFRFWVVSKKAD
ncbi:peptide/nickel transport system substrate-binding protein [Solirubrobacter pauli]|uniref:Peptide/nickel transport system substrate-binding protein n=1 Tax=Solirubrobacter pauli TaxID=166793 RepID=A0A660LFG5_9ACTN|nr:peptide/nickel transport system substrate-binding protein [Solirubrobacter pauli]